MTSIFHCLLIWAVSASASDDQSLMQQGVGIESGVLEGTVTNQFKQNLNTITSALREIPFPGKMRQMAIDALMKSVSKAERLDPTNEGLLRQILTLLEDVRLAFAAETTIANTDAGDANIAIAACNAAGDTAEVTAAKAVSDAKAAHTTCRGEEVSAHNTMNTDCQNLVVILSGLSSSDCSGHSDPGTQYYGHINQVINPVDYANLLNAGTYHISGTNVNGATDTHFLDGWVAAYSSAYHGLHGHKGTWDTNQAQCKSSIDTFNAKASECNTLQGTYESDYCQHVFTRNGQCALLDTCYNAAVAAHALVVTAHQADATQREAIVRVIVYVECLIGDAHGLLGGNLNPDAACVPVQTAFDYTPYTWINPGTDAKDGCTAVPGAEPGQANFNDENYAAEDAARVTAGMVTIYGAIQVNGATC